MQEPSIKYGILAGVGTILYTLLFYLVDKSLIVHLGVSWSAMIIYFIAMLLAIRAQRDLDGGYISLRAAIKAAFKTFLIANVFYHLFTYAMYNFIDPELLELRKEVLISTYKWLYSGEQLEMILKDFTALPFQVSIGDVLFGFAKGAIGGFILSFILAGTQRNA